MNDLILNGPFGDVRGLQWGEDASQTGIVEGIINSPNIAIYSTSDDISGNRTYPGGLTAFRHTAFKLFYCGDGGFMSSPSSTSDMTSSTITPFMLDNEKRPVYKSGYGRSSSNRFEVYNSQIYANMIVWAITQTQ
jgi:hypothetical protein